MCKYLTICQCLRIMSNNDLWQFNTNTLPPDRGANGRRVVTTRELHLTCCQSTAYGSQNGPLMTADDDDVCGGFKFVLPRFPCWMVKPRWTFAKREFNPPSPLCLGGTANDLAGTVGFAAETLELSTK